ncbi:MAG TPA: hypothetical protein VLJ17_19210 [Xanthobacteraceae bacterium]|nr:hypothetical protein [Xanthobacteraceae bacterium]
MGEAVIAVEDVPWYRLLSRSQWSTLIAANLGWTFDGYETCAVVLTVGVALRELLDSSQYSQIPVYAGTVIALTLLGWGVGGLIGGVLADYLGHRKAVLDQSYFRPSSSVSIFLTCIISSSLIVWPNRG